MEYKGFIAEIEYDTEDQIYVGHLAGIQAIVGFHGETLEALNNAFHEAVDDYLAISDKAGRPTQMP